MKDDTILQLTDPAGISPDPLMEILRKGARDLLAQAVEAEVCDLLTRHAHLKDAAGRARVVRHGYLPEREVMIIARQAIAQQSAERGDRPCSGEGSTST